MGQPTDILIAQKVLEQSQIAADKMVDALNNVTELLYPTASVFNVPDVRDSLGSLDVDNAFYDASSFDDAASAIAQIATDYNTISVNPGTAPSAPTLTNIPAISTPSVPSLTATMPIVNIPTAPSIAIPALPTAPSIEDTLTPDAPIVAIPSVPELSDIALPSISSISIPTFAQAYPDVPEDLLASSETFFYEEPEYSTEELSAMRDLVLDDLRNGGWGVNHVDEEALFDREVDRATAAGVNDEETTIESMASRGFEVPTGTLAAMLRRGQQKTLNEISAANREVSVQRADLIRKSRENVLANTLTLNQTMVTHFGFVQQRKLSVAQSVVDFSLRAVASQIDIYNMRVQAYAAYATAWNMQIRGQLSQLEAEKAQLEAEAMKIDLNKSQIDAYSAQVRAVGLAIDIYNTEMQAAKIRSDIERNKLAVYNTQVDAHRSVITAEIAKVQAYTAQVSAEGTRVDLYKTQVDAHSSEVSASKVVSDIQVQAASIALDEQRVQLQSYESDIRGFVANIQSVKASADVAIAATDGAGRLSAAQGDLTAAQAQIHSGAVTSLNSANSLIAQMEADQQRTFSDHNIKLMQSRVEYYTKPAELWQEFYTSIGALSSAVDVEVSG